TTPIWTLRHGITNAHAIVIASNGNAGAMYRKFWNDHSPDDAITARISTHGDTRISTPTRSLFSRRAHSTTRTAPTSHARSTIFGSTSGLFGSQNSPFSALPIRSRTVSNQ